MTIDFGAVAARGHLGVDVFGPGVIIFGGRGLGVELRWPPSWPRRRRAMTRWSPQLAGEEWLGPSSAVMAAAVQPYVAWMTTTAGQAEQAAAPGPIGRGGL